MVIKSNTDRIRKLRKNLAELLVAQAPNSRAIQDIAVRCGVEEVRYKFRNDNCVLCGRCVRVCTEVWKARAIGFVGEEESGTWTIPSVYVRIFANTATTASRCAP